MVSQHTHDPDIAPFGPVVDAPGRPLFVRPITGDTIGRAIDGPDLYSSLADQHRREALRALDRDYAIVGWGLAVGMAVVVAIRLGQLGVFAWLAGLFL